MIINSEIISYFLENKHLKDYQNHWVYKQIVPGEYTFEEPVNVDYKQLTKLYNLVKKQITNFEPTNQFLWNQIFDGIEIPESTTIYLIVGAPQPYDAMVREYNGERYIILDLIRILSYTDDFDRLKSIVNDFLTHEIAHILIGSKYPYLESMSLEDTFIQMIFDEGIAHFISYKEDVLNVDWKSPDMKKHYQNVVEKLRYYLNNRNEISEQTLIEANSGTFWGKYASIGGMFAIKEYYDAHLNFSNLLNDGPEILLDFIK